MALSSTPSTPSGTPSGTPSTASSTPTTGDARERLLTRLLDVFDDGLPPPETSLREIATRTGTSHALLRYHFGSLAGVLAAVLGAQRTRDNKTLVKTADQATFTDLAHAIWQVYTRPDQLSRIRGFFHVVGLAAYRPDDFREFISSLDDLTKLLASLAEREGLTPDAALTRATLVTATMRGLLLQEVLTAGSCPQNAVDLILNNPPHPHPATGAR
ncbi:TetR/AcrR family transcriptional regulator [Actinosynnema pretiosum subsp. pretiosum]|uniref:TetR/AcrR family transcriptional regulator n=1 Tax=Actinosynnema pretiosum subsp. pretiosum TaxID=103721 RepID=A0AA45L7M5_9PSEU|nr:regulatory protein, TetR [Actinosynnema pretiosum subsp. pretiosum]QUF04752.1 TetR/AcrR family transcriptional regulator [Actinosynnema pretiosum subsp. pretiosum]